MPVVHTLGFELTENEGSRDSEVGSKRESSEAGRTPDESQKPWHPRNVIGFDVGVVRGVSAEVYL